MTRRRVEVPADDPDRIARQAGSLARAERFVEAWKTREATASRIVDKVRSGALADGFTRRLVLQHGWSGLSSVEHVDAALNLLAEQRGLSRVKLKTGGRPKTVYRFEAGTGAFTRSE